MKKLSILCVLFALFGVAAISAPVRAQAKADTESAIREHVLEGKYYHLTYNGTKAEAEDALALLEAAWPQYKTFFGKAAKVKKKERLKVVVDRTQEQMKTRLAELGAPNMEGGGIYLFKTKTAYAYRHPTVQGAREIILHECAHQYHYRSTSLSEGIKSKWFIEGVAELLSMHTWDGKNLSIGDKPLLSVADKMEQGLKTFQRKDFSLEALVDNTFKVSYPEWAALAHWMQHGDKGKNAKKYAKMRKALESGRSGKSAFVSAFGKPKKAQKQLVEWLSENMQTWSYVFRDWDCIADDALVGESPNNTVATIKGKAQELSCTLHAVKEKWQGGLVVSYVDREDYTFVKVINGERAELHRRYKGKWETPKPIELDSPKKRKTLALRIRREKERVIFSCEGKDVGSWPISEGQFGVMVAYCRLTFKDLTWKLAPKPKPSKKKKR